VLNGGPEVLLPLHQDAGGDAVDGFGVDIKTYRMLEVISGSSFVDYTMVNDSRSSQGPQVNKDAATLGMPGIMLIL